MRRTYINVLNISQKLFFAFCKKMTIHGYYHAQHPAMKICSGIYENTWFRRDIDMVINDHIFSEQKTF